MAEDSILNEEYTVEVTVYVTVRIHDPSVITRCVNNEDNWQNKFYNITTRDQVLAHLAYNAVANGCDDLRHLDGWADIPKGASMEVDVVDTWVLK